MNWVKLEPIFFFKLAFLRLWMLSRTAGRTGRRDSRRSPDALGFFFFFPSLPAAWRQMWANNAVIYGRIMTTIIFTTSNVPLSRFCPKWGSWKSYKTVKHPLIYAEILFYPLLAICVAIEVCAVFCVSSCVCVCVCVCVKQPPPQIC